MKWTRHRSQVTPNRSGAQPDLRTLPRFLANLLLPSSTFHPIVPACPSSPPPPLPTLSHPLPTTTQQMSVALAPKPSHLSFSPTILHRRHPSAPVVVQPTRTPGLLAIKQPQRPTPSSAQRHVKAASKPAKANQVVRASTLVPMQPVAAQATGAAPSAGQRHLLRLAARAHAKSNKDKVLALR